MKTKINVKLLVLCIAIPLLVGGISALLTRGSMAMFEDLVKPPLALPGWLFPVVWTILFVFVGIDSDYSGAVLPYLETGRISADSVPVMGDICGILKLCYLAAELGSLF